MQLGLRDPRFGRTGSDLVLLQVLGQGPVLESFRRWMLFLDPPGHTRLRTLITRAFTPGTVARLREHIADLVDGLLDGLEPAGRADLIADFAYLLPVQVICELLAGL